MSSAFHDLHAPGRLLILPNAWDAGSARLIEDCGAPAIATTSAGLAWARRYPDGNALPVPVLAAAIAQIARVVRVPVSADVEGGYAGEAAFNVSGKVGDNGAVTVTVSRGSQSARGQGRLSATDGSGMWTAGSGECSGTWTAERRSS